jgi:hypothetical protein
MYFSHEMRHTDIMDMLDAVRQAMEDSGGAL